MNEDRGTDLWGWIVILVIVATVFGDGAKAAPSPPAAPAPPPAQTAVSLSGAMTPASWAQAFLGALGDGATPENMRAVTAWERAEGGHWQDAARFNPLNTTQREPGSTSINSVGVQAFTSWAQGLQATVATITNGRYGGVLAALRAGACAACVAAAVGASPWGTGRFPV